MELPKLRRAHIFDKRSHERSCEICNSKRKWARCGAGDVVVLGLKLVDFLGPAEDRYDRSGADLRRRTSGMVADDYRLLILFGLVNAFRLLSEGQKISRINRKMFRSIDTSNCMSIDFCSVTRPVERWTN